MTSGIINTTQSKNITSPQNNLESSNTNMYRVQQRRSRVLIYTNCDGDNVDLGGDRDGDGDVAVDDEDGTSPHAKGVSVEMPVSTSPRLWPQSSRICHLPERKRTIGSAAISENSVKIRASFFPRYGGLVKNRRGGDARGRRWAPPCSQKLGPVVVPTLALAWTLVSPLRRHCFS
jgi:hypothetical protein